MLTEIESFSKQPFYATLMQQDSLLGLSKAVIDALHFQSYNPHILDLMADDIPLLLRNHLIELGQNLYKNREFYCNRFYNGVLDPNRSTPRQPKAGYELTLESVIVEIESVAKTFTIYKKDLFKLIENNSIKQEDIGRHLQIIVKMEQFETAILFSLKSTPEYNQSEELQYRFQDLKSLSFSDIIESSAKDIVLLDDIPPDEVVAILQSEDFSASSTSFLYHEETKEMRAELGEFPKSHGISLTDTDCLVLGDLHANPIKLIYFLLYENIMTGISEEDYEALLNIYYSRTNEHKCLLNGDFFSSNDVNHPREKLKQFNKIIEKLTPVNTDAVPSILLLGDVLADRGTNDYYTLRLLQQLKVHKIFPKILLSNHDREFLAIYENDGFCRFEGMSIYTTSAYKTTLGFKQSASLMGLGNFLRLGLITKEEILYLIENVYLPLLTGLELKVDFEKKVLICFTHAPVPITIIPKLAQELELPCDDEAILFQSPEKVLETAEAINTRLKRLLREKKLLQFSKEGASLYNLMWARAPRYSQWASNELPVNWSMIHVHGHDGFGTGRATYPSSSLSIYDLDNLLGKDLTHSGTYTVFYYGNNAKYIAERTKTAEIEMPMPPKRALSSSTFFQAYSASSSSPNAEKSIEDSALSDAARPGG